MIRSIPPRGSTFPRGERRRPFFTLGLSPRPSLRHYETPPQQTAQWRPHATQQMRRKRPSPLILNPLAIFNELTRVVFGQKLADFFDMIDHKTALSAEEGNAIGLEKYLKSLLGEIKKMAEQNPELREYLSEFLFSKNINAEDFFKP